MNASIKKYLFRIFKLIFLTDILSLLLFTENYPIWLGYVLGSLASFGNFYFQAKNTEKLAGIAPSSAKANVFKNFYLRYLLLIIAVILILKFINVNIIALFVGLIAVQLAIGINQILENLFEKKI